MSNEPECTEPFSDAFDCPVHDPRKAEVADPRPARAEKGEV